MLDRDDFLTDEEYQEAVEKEMDRAEMIRDEMKFEAFLDD